jgi:predicted Zn-dependent protease with MMP-like domain
MKSTIGTGHTIKSNVIYPMAEATNSESFEEVVEWAYGTLPQEIRDLPDFPGIQVADEPPEDVLKRKKWPPGREMLGLYSGIYRTERLHNHIRTAPDLIFVFRGPISRCSRGDLRAEVKEVVWHEVAHWLGHDEEDVKDLGLSTLSLPVEDVERRQLENKTNKVGLEAAKTVPQQRLPDILDEAGDAKEQQLRCLKCYSADITCRELDKLMTRSGEWLGDPLPVHAKICTCRSCGYEWDDEDNT